MNSIRRLCNVYTRPKWEIHRCSLTTDSTIHFGSNGCTDSSIGPSIHPPFHPYTQPCIHQTINHAFIHLVIHPINVPSIHSSILLHIQTLIIHPRTQAESCEWIMLLFHVHASIIHSSIHYFIPSCTAIISYYFANIEFPFFPSRRFSSASLPRSYRSCCIKDSYQKTTLWKDTPTLASPGLHQILPHNHAG